MHQKTNVRKKVWQTMPHWFHTLLITYQESNPRGLHKSQIRRISIYPSLNYVDSFNTYEVVEDIKAGDSRKYIKFKVEFKGTHSKYQGVCCKFESRGNSMPTCACIIYPIWRLHPLLQNIYFNFGGRTLNAKHLHEKPLYNHITSFW